MELAESYLLKSLKIMEKVYSINHPDLASCLNSLGTLYYIQNKINKAEVFFKRSLTILSNSDERHSDVAGCLLNLGAVYEIKRNYSKAETSYLKSLNIFIEIFNTSHPNIGRVLYQLIMLYKSRHNYKEMNRYILQAKTWGHYFKW